MSPAKPLVRQVRIRYFAVLREHVGISSEERETTSTTVEELYGEIKEEKGFNLEKEFIRFACNGDFVDLDCSLTDGDEIVFIPPVAGG
jgi:molybdopterin converting factor subunit 1